jgi:hypothetical protein
MAGEGAARQESRAVAQRWSSKEFNQSVQPRTTQSIITELVDASGQLRSS